MHRIVEKVRGMKLGGSTDLGRDVTMFFAHRDVEVKKNKRIHQTNHSNIPINLKNKQTNK